MSSRSPPCPDWGVIGPYFTILRLLTTTIRGERSGGLEVLTCILPPTEWDSSRSTGTRGPDPGRDGTPVVVSSSRSRKGVPRVSGLSRQGSGTMFGGGRRLWSYPTPPFCPLSLWGDFISSVYSNRGLNSVFVKTTVEQGSYSVLGNDGDSQKDGSFEGGRRFRIEESSGSGSG